MQPIADTKVVIDSQSREGAAGVAGRYASARASEGCVL